MGLFDGFKGMLAEHTPNWLPEDPDKNAAARQALLAAGAAMMSTKGHNFFGSVGQGLLAGGETYQGVLAQQQQDRLRKAQQERWDLDNQQNTAKLAREKEADDIIASFGGPGSISGAAGVASTSGGAQSPAGSAPGAPGGGAAPAPLGPEPLGPPPHLPRIGQPRRPPAVDSSLEGAPGAGGTMPSAFTPGQPPRLLPSLEGLPMLDGAQSPRGTATSLEGLPKIGDSPHARANYAEQAYEENMRRYLALMKKDHISRAKPYYEAAKRLEPKVKEIREMTTADGKTVVANIYEDGRPPQPIDGYIPSDPKLTYHNTGGETLGLDPRGKVVVRFQNSERPGSRSRAGAGGAGVGADAALDDETLDMMADQALRGDRTVFQNVGRGAQGSANLVALRKRITQKAKAQGITGADLASITADYSGQQAGLRTSGTISARIENAAAEAAELAPLAIEAGRNVSRAGFLPFGRAQVMFDTKTNDPALNKFATANIGLATAYANAMARGQKATVGDMHEARELLTTAKSQDAYEAIVNQMLQEIKAAQRAPQHVRENLRGQISGRGGDHGAPPGGERVMTLADIAETARKSGRSTKDVTAAARAKGFKIQGEK
ncbi:hypothetical protein [Agrobacterium tumefaciens]|uniref:hypothetical protein n=1 Tax=Agrobacterium tumefaciens TaxID=358 RepID=UPI001571A681|nr:hypothetical protein [Agrobacterium tumefaciens]NTB05799.1 hypothetical protein [Agrobacterium tumefaciens]